MARWNPISVVFGLSCLGSTLPGVSQTTTQPRTGTEVQNSGAGTASDTDWPLLRQNPQNTGYSPVVLRPPMKLRWRTRVHGDRFQPNAYPGYHHGSPIAVRAGVFVAAERLGTSAPTLLALDPRTGSVRWQLPGVVGPGSCFGNRLVTVRLQETQPTQPRGKHIRHSLIALDAQTGKLLWELPTGEFGPYFTRGYYVPPYPLPGGKELLWNLTKELVAVDVETGRIVRRRPLPEAGLTGLPAIADGRLVMHRIAGTEARGVHGGYVVMDSSTLEEKSLGRSGYTTPLLFGDYLVNGYGDYLGEVDIHRRTGDWDYTFAWRARSTAHAAFVVLPHAQGPRLVLYIPWDPLRKQGHRIRTFDLKSGRTVWDYGPLTATGYAAASRGVVYVPGYANPGSSDRPGGIYALDAEKGRLLWKYERKDFYLGGLAITSEGIYASGSDGYLYAFAPR